ncbi:MAG: reverse transcriptase-like protein [Chloroflexaceae bacterium]|nr:reverse transcriptase-like protein [Chloroflexaceae bacterium]
MNHALLLVQVDGTPGSPPRGVAGIGVVVRAPRGNLICTRCLRAPAATNHEAEYQAVIAGLELMLTLYRGVAVRCMSDSRTEVWRCCGGVEMWTFFQIFLE